MFGGIDMRFWELLVLVGTMATILGVFLTVYALINNKILREESRLTREIIGEFRKSTEETLKEIAKGQEIIARLIVAEGERTRQAVKA